VDARAGLWHDGVMEPELFSSIEVSRECGVSLRQLQWWDEQGIISPKIERGNRGYSRSDIALVAVVAKLRRCGYSMQSVRRVIGQFKRRASAAAFAIVQESDVVWCNTQSAVLEVLQNASQASVLIELS
jgi:DNA-binding transcriptional MerR regulator